MSNTQAHTQAHTQEGSDLDRLLSSIDRQLLLKLLDSLIDEQVPAKEVVAP